MNINKEINHENYKEKSKKVTPASLIIFAVLITLGVTMLLPFILMIVISLERYANIAPPFPPSFVVKDFSFFNYKLVFENGLILKAYMYSSIIAFFSVVLNLVAVLLAGYAFSKGRFAYKNIFLAAILMTMMIPFETRLIPMYLMFSKVGLNNTIVPLILPSIIDGFGIILAKQFFDKLPDSFLESAQIDGCGKLQAFIMIYAPLTGPITATIVILKFMGSWNSFLWPLIILTDGKIKTVPIFMAMFSNEGGTRLAGLTMASAFLSIAPVVVVFLVMQRFIIESIALTGLKGE